MKKLRKFFLMMLVVMLVSVLLPVTLNPMVAKASDYTSPEQVRYEYYNWYDNPIGWQILEGETVENGGSIVSVVQEEGEWMQRGTPPSGGASEDHIFRHRLVVTVKNNKPCSEWPGTNTHHGFKIRIWDSGTLKYVDDMRDPLYDYSPGHHWYPSSVDCHFITFCTSYYTSQGGGGDGNKYTREYFQIYINWRCVCNTLPIGSISGYKWADCNENGEWDTWESGLCGWEIKLSKMVGVNWEYQSSATTGTGGEYSFTELGSGTYEVEEVLKTGWVQTYPPDGTYIFTLGAAEAKTGVNFGNHWTGGDICTSGVVESSQGLTKDSQPVLPIRSNPDSALGSPDSTYGQEDTFFSLGYGGHIILEFPDLISGNITVYETTWGQYPPETAEVYASQNGATWLLLGTADNSAGMGGNDPHPTTFTLTTPLKYVKVVDTTDPTPHDGASDAFDLDAVCGRYVCEPPQLGSISGYKYGCDSIYVDIGDETSETQVAMAGWGPMEPATHGGTWGGIAPGNCRVIWDISDDDPEATVTFTLPATLEPGKLKWKSLDGTADDSYEVYVNDTLVYTYEDTEPIDDPEAWYEVSQDISALPEASVVTVRFKATGSKWSGFDTYGQVAFDWIELLHCTRVGLSGWTITLSGDASNSTTTNIDGYYEFTGLSSGSYTVTETLKEGWENCTPISIGIVLGASENSVNNNFCNRELAQEPGSISGYKWADCNEDSEWSGEEVGLANWEIKLFKKVGAEWVEQTSTKTGTGGVYSFTHLEPGEYKVEEVLKTGWTQTFPSTGVYTFTLGAGEAETNVNFGNHWIGENGPQFVGYDDETEGYWQTKYGYCFYVLPNPEWKGSPELHVGPDWYSGHPEQYDYDEGGGRVLKHEVGALDNLDWASMFDFRVFTLNGTCAWAWPSGATTNPDGTVKEENYLDDPNDGGYYAEVGGAQYKPSKGKYFAVVWDSEYFSWEPLIAEVKIKQPGLYQVTFNILNPNNRDLDLWLYVNGDYANPVWSGHQDRWFGDKYLMFMIRTDQADTTVALGSKLTNPGEVANAYISGIFVDCLNCEPDTKVDKTFQLTVNNPENAPAGVTYHAKLSNKADGGSFETEFQLTGGPTLYTGTITDVPPSPPNYDWQIWATWDSSTVLIDSGTESLTEDKTNSAEWTWLLLSISGYKWCDCNEDGEKQDIESGLPNWEIKLYGWDGATWVYQSSTTTSDAPYGTYDFDGLVPGEYRVEETLKAGYKQTYPAPPGYHEITLDTESATNINFGNTNIYNTKTFVLTFHACTHPWKNIDYYGAVRLVGETTWSVVQLSKDDSLFTGEVGGLEDGEYDWKIYTIYSGDEIIITGGTENILNDKKNCFKFGVTSLGITKTVESVTKEDSTYTISGKIIVQNTGHYPAIVTDVKDTIEYKLPQGPDWGSIVPLEFTHNIPDIIPLTGGTYDYSVTFSRDGISSKGWQNLLEITIFNHPDGFHKFHDRASFNLPDNPGLKPTQLKLTVTQYSYGYSELVVLKATLKTTVNASEPIPKQYVLFYIDGNYSARRMTNRNGMAMYYLWMNKGGRTHTAYAVFEGSSEYEASTSNTVTWKEKYSYYRWYW
jgi:hypothetical protein